MGKMGRKCETECSICARNETDFCSCVARSSKNSRTCVGLKEEKKAKVNKRCRSDNVLKKVSLKSTTVTCSDSSQVNAKDLTSSSRQSDMETNEEKKKSTGYVKFPNDSTQWCVFHGTTTFRMITSTSRFFPFCVERKRLSSSLVCWKCCTKLEKFLNAAKQHNCTIEKIDYPIWLKESNGKEYERISQAENRKKKDLASSNSCTPWSFLKDQFRVQVMCVKLHRFLLTEAHLNQNVWCPFCVLSEKNHCNGKNQTNLWQQLNARKLQKELLESAKSSFLKNIQKAENPSVFRCKILPPSFTTPLTNLSMKLSKACFSKNGSVNVYSCEKKEKNTIHSLAIKDMALYKNVTYSQACAVIRIRMADSNPASILQVRNTSNVKEVQAAYRKLARLVHPDKNHHPEANAVFHTLQWAWQSLTESQRFV